MLNKELRNCPDNSTYIFLLIQILNSGLLIWLEYRSFNVKTRLSYQIAIRERNTECLCHRPCSHSHKQSHRYILRIWKGECVRMAGSQLPGMGRCQPDCIWWTGRSLCSSFKCTAMEQSCLYHSWTSSCFSRGSSYWPNEVSCCFSLVHYLSLTTWCHTKMW